MRVIATARTPDPEHGPGRPSRHGRGTSHDPIREATGVCSIRSYGDLYARYDQGVVDFPEHRRFKEEVLVMPERRPPAEFAMRHIATASPRNEWQLVA